MLPSTLAFIPSTMESSARRKSHCWPWSSPYAPKGPPGALSQCRPGQRLESILIKLGHPVIPIKMAISWEGQICQKHAIVYATDMPLSETLGSSLTSKRLSHFTKVEVVGLSFRTHCRPPLPPQLCRFWGIGTSMPTITRVSSTSRPKQALNSPARLILTLELLNNLQMVLYLAPRLLSPECGAVALSGKTTLEHSQRLQVDS